MGRKRQAPNENPSGIPGDFKHIKDRNQRRFLAAFANGVGTITAASDASGVSRSSHRRWIENDPDYQAAFYEANEIIIERLEAVSMEHARDGWEEPVYQKGELVGTVRKYSENLAMFLLRGARPEKYRERFTAEITAASDISDRLRVGMSRAALVAATEPKKDPVVVTEVESVSS